MKDEEEPHSLSHTPYVQCSDLVHAKRGQLIYPNSHSFQEKGTDQGDTGTKPMCQGQGHEEVSLLECGEGTPRWSQGRGETEGAVVWRCLGLATIWV